MFEAGPCDRAGTLRMVLATGCDPPSAPRRLAHPGRPRRSPGRAASARLTGMTKAGASSADATPSPGFRGVADLPKDVVSSLATRWRNAARIHRSMALPLESFVVDILLLWHRAKERQGLRPTEQLLRADLARLHVEDLYLARLCERGDAKAWGDFCTRYEPDLAGVLRRYGGAADAEQVAATVIANAALPPARKPDRTHLGTYEGSGPLWAWLATIGIRTLRRSWGERGVSLDAAAGTPAPHAPATTPSEEAARFEDAFAAAWACLEPREALSLSFKYGDGLRQREVALLLGVSEPTASRLHQRAIDKLRGQLVDHALPQKGPDERAQFVAALTRHFERVRVLENSMDGKHSSPNHGQNEES